MLAPLLRRLAAPGLALCLALTAAHADEVLTLEEDMGIPKLERIDASIDSMSFGLIEIHLTLGYDERGRVIATGPCTVDGHDVSVAGSVKQSKKTGDSSYKIRLKNKTQRLNVLLKGDLEDGIADAGGKYKSPRGTAKGAVGDFYVLVTATEDPEAFLELTFGEDGTSQVAVLYGGALDVVDSEFTVEYGNIPAEAGTFAQGKLKKTKLTLKAQRGLAKATYKGKWNGSEYVGKLIYKVPPHKGVMKDYVVPGFVVPKDPAPAGGSGGATFKLLAKTGDKAPGVGSTFFAFGGSGGASSLHINDNDVITFYAVPLPNIFGGGPLIFSGLWSGTEKGFSVRYHNGMDLVLPGFEERAPLNFTVREFNNDGDAVIQAVWENLDVGLCFVDRANGDTRHIASTFDGFDLLAAQDPLFWDDETVAVNDGGVVSFYALDRGELEGGVYVNRPGGDLGTTTPIAHDGDPLRMGPDTATPASVDFFVDITGDGHTVFRTGPTDGLFRTTGQGIPGLYEDFTTLAFEDEPGPIQGVQADPSCTGFCVDEDYTWQLIWIDFLAGSVSLPGPVVAFTGYYDGPDVDFDHDDGLWIQHPAHLFGGTQLVMREGDHVPASNMKVAGDFNPLLIASEHVVFAGELDQDPDDFGEETMILRWDGRAVGFFAMDSVQQGKFREISHIYGYAQMPGLLFRSDDDALTLPDYGGALWIANADLDNSWIKVVEVGESFRLSKNDSRVIKDFWCSNVNRKGKFLMVLQFQNDTQALFLVNGGQVVADSR